MKLSTLGFYAIVLFVVLLDQGVKAWTRSPSGIPVGGTIPLIPGVFELSHVQNIGMAFSLLEGKTPFLITAAVLVAVVIIVAQWRMRSKLSLLLGISLALPLGGAIGNLIDRVWKGYVTDLFYFKLIKFPVFNVADSAITVGMALLFWHTLTTKETDSPVPVIPVAPTVPEPAEAQESSIATVSEEQS